MEISKEQEWPLTGPFIIGPVLWQSKYETRSNMSNIPGILYPDPPHSTQGLQFYILKSAQFKI